MIAWGKEKAQHWLGILDKDLMGPERNFLCGEDVTLGDYVGAELVTLGELVHCKYEDYPNARRWIGNKKSLKHWNEVHPSFNELAGSLRDKAFVSI